MFRALVKAPSNIALIKYMGKTDPSQNQAANPSVSMTLNSLCSYFGVQTSAADSFQVVWNKDHPSSDQKSGIAVPDLSQKEQERIGRHFDRCVNLLPKLFTQFDLRMSAPIRLEWTTANSFPASAGIASSASSMAAATLAFGLALSDDPKAFEKLYLTEDSFRSGLSQLSRQGSGSSCRSFGGPFVHWSGSNVQSLQALGLFEKYGKFADLVLVVDSGKKEVSSSEAHLRVFSSPLWHGREARVERKTADLLVALQSGDLRTLAELTWQESWEMHSLFHTSQPPFSYWKPGTVAALQFFSKLLKSESEPPIVTMDAGPNLHVLVPLTKSEEWKEKIQAEFPSFSILSDSNGEGAAILEWVRNDS